MKVSTLQLVLRTRLWFQERLRISEQPVILFWAGLVGFVGALAAMGFRQAIAGLQWLLTSSSGELVQTARALPWWERLLVPAVGGFFAGLILNFGMKLVKRQSSTDYMEAVAVRYGIIRMRSTLIKTLSSWFSIASGASIGREGPMVQLSAMLASLIGRKTHMSEPRLRLLVACGVAAGIASAYNTPIMGALFVAEIILGSIAMEMFGPLIFSSVVATITMRQLFGAKPVYEMPPFHVVSNWEFVFYIVLGLIIGGFAAIFLRLLRIGETAFTSSGLPLFARLTLGGMAVGVISVLVPEVWGNGYSVVSSIVHEQWVWQGVLVILVAKLLATATSIGSGAVGGVFTPTLFVGAALGCLMGKFWHALAPMITAGPEAYAIVGMGSFLAATTQAPLMAILMLFEMTLQYDVVLPLLLACVTAHFIVKGIGESSIYAVHLRKEAQMESNLTFTQVRDLIRHHPVCLSPEAPLYQAAQAFIGSLIHYVYVVDAAGHFLGVIALQDLKSALKARSRMKNMRAMDVLKSSIPLLTPEVSWIAALELFSRHDGNRLPVVNNMTEKKLLGTVSRSDLLLALSESKLHQAHPN